MRDVAQFTRFLRRYRSVWFLVIGILFVIAASVLVSIAYWDSLNVVESISATIRNLALVVSVVIALPLAIWRSMVAEQQAKTAYRGLLNERYQKGSEMMGSNILSVRLGGIYALRRLAEEHPEEYYVNIIRLFCAFVRHPIHMDNSQFERRESPINLLKPRPDIHAILETMFHTDKQRIELENEDEFRLDFQGADFHKLDWMFFSTINLRGADLSHADLSGSNFTGYAFMYDEEVDLSGVSLFQANLSGTNLCGVTGLTQSMLDFANADLENPPYLRDMFDPKTKKPLIWNR